MLANHFFEYHYVWQQSNTQMPLKYIFHHPEYVRLAGSIHGFLFVSFMITIFILLFKKEFEIKNAVYAFLLSLIPFGTFFLHKTLKNNGQ